MNERTEYEYGVRWPDGSVTAPHRNEQPSLGGKPFYAHLGAYFVRREVVRGEWGALPPEIAQARQRFEELRRVR